MASRSAKPTEQNSDVTNQQLEVIDPIYQKYVSGVIRALGSTDFYEYFMESVSRAENEFQFSNRRLEKYVDTEWIDAVENALEGFQNVLASPRNVIKEDEVIVNVANAKKAGSDVVRHLATHAALVEHYDERNNEVRPERLMQKYREDTIGIYENRLVFTTLERAYQFVKIRHDALFQSMGDEFGAKLKVSSNMYSATETVHMDMFMHIKDSEGALEIDEKNRDVFDRVSRLYRILSMHMNSRFAQQMSRIPRITGSVTKTNVLKKNPNYVAVVKLFDFLTHYDNIGYTIKVIEQNPVINEDFERDIYHNILFNYLVLKGHLERDKDRQLPAPLKEKKRKLKPKFIKQIIEELTEDYDLPDVEVRKVLIEELTKEQLMLEEQEERRRLVEELERRKQEEEERLRLEQEAEEERKRQEKEAAEERRRQEKEIIAAQKMLERMEREQETRRRSGLFKQETEKFFKELPERMELRMEEEAKETVEEQDFADAVQIMEETERLKAEEIARLRRRKQEEKERQRLEAMLEQERVERELAEEHEKMLIAEEIRQARQYEQDMETVAPFSKMLEDFERTLSERLKHRTDAQEAKRAALKKRENERKRREQDRNAKSN